MSTTFSPYDTLVQHLLLPPDIRQIVEIPFNERGYPLTEEVTYDYARREVPYLASIYNDQKVVLLHMVGDVIADRNNFRDVVSVANVFTRKTENSAGLFVFAPVKDLNPQYKIDLAPSLKEDSPSIKEARFFDQAEIDYLKAMPPQPQKKLVTSLLALDALLPRRNGVELDPSEIKERVIQLVIKRCEIAQRNVRDFFVDLRDELSWPPGWEWQPKTDTVPRVAARELVVYLLNQKSYPRGVMDGYKPLGDLLCRLIPAMGRDFIDEMYQMITEYQLVEPNALNEYRQYVQREFKLILPT